MSENLQNPQNTDSKYSKFIHFITKNAIISTLVMFASVGFLTVVGAQAFAPENLKPAKLIGITKSNSSANSDISNQKSSVENLDTEKTNSTNTELLSKQTTPLEGDTENDLLLVDKCDLQFKFAKKITNQGMLSTSYNVEKTNRLIVEYSWEIGSGPGAKYFISCENKAYSFNDFNNSFTSKQADASSGKYFDNDPTLGNIEISDISKNDLCVEIGLVQSSCDSTANHKKITAPQAEGSVVTYYFTDNSRTYLISYVGYRPKEAKTMFQFNALSSPKLESTDANNANLKTYTNQYYPGLKLVYDNTWEFKTSTTPSSYQGLLNRDVFLTKNGVVFKLQMQPKSNISCRANSAIIEKIKFNNDVYKQKLNTNPNTVNYGTDTLCVPVELTTNIPSKDSANYAKDFPGDVQIKYTIYLNLFKVAGASQEGVALLWTDPIVSEIDQIISQSSFR